MSVPECVSAERETVIYRSEVLAILGAISGLVVDVRESETRWRTTMKKKRKKTTEIPESARLLRELYERGMAELAARRERDPNAR